jgi:prevent-host-death family protein
MRFSSDEIQPFYEVRQNLSKAIDEVERGCGEIVIAKHGKPVAALLSAEGLYRYRQLVHELCEYLAKSESKTDDPIEIKNAKLSLRQLVATIKKESA